MPSPIAAYQIRPIKPETADGPIAAAIGDAYQAWQTFTAYPLNSDLFVCGSYAVVAVHERTKKTLVHWREVLHSFETSNPRDALRQLWKVAELKPSPRKKPADEPA